MPSKTKSQLEAENAALRVRLSELQAALSRNGGLPAQPELAVPPITLALQASEVRYRRLFETAKDGILILDAETGQITDANPFMEDLLGYPRGELLGKALWDLGPFKDIVASQAAFRQLQLQKYVRYEDLPLETKDGQRRQVEFVSNVY